VLASSINPTLPLLLDLAHSTTIHSALAHFARALATMAPE